MFPPKSIFVRTFSALGAGSLLALLPLGMDRAVAATPLASDSAPSHERSPVLAAALASDWKTVAALLKDGANPGLADDLGLTPLMATAISGHVPTLEALLAAGASPAAVDARGRTALGYAVALRHSAAVTTLLAHQPTLPAAAEGGDDLAAVALDTGDRNLIETIFRRLPAGLTWTPAARAAFAQALASRDTIFGPLFLAKYTGSPSTSETSQPLLAYAIIRGDAEQLRTLLQFGADPNTVIQQPVDKDFRDLVSSNYVRYYLDSTQGISMLMLAAGMKQTECLKVLLEYGANRLASTRGRSQLIALYFAAWADCPEALQALIPSAPSKDQLWIEVSIAEQRARYYRDQKLILTTTISTGRAGFPTRPGEYVITDKNRHHRSSIYREASMPYFMRLSCRDFGLHEGYVTGQPASHGCIRLPGEIARRLFSEVPVGTWVSIRGRSTEPEPKTRSASRGR